MHLLSLCITLLFSVGTYAYQFQSTKGSDSLAARALSNQLNYTYGHSSQQKAKCGKDQIARRKEWHALSDAERKDYIDANLCLLRSASRNRAFAPGARNRYDDFVAVHINQTLTIHGTGNFLAFHRYMTWAWEQTLRNECGYKGFQPYWNWAKTANDPRGAPIFDGGPLSLSGDGKYIEHPATDMMGPNGSIHAPPGRGSGCLKSGPFKDMIVNLGPGLKSSLYKDVRPNPRKDSLGYNPRCIRRDISPFISRGGLQDVNITDLIGSQTFSDFLSAMQSGYPHLNKFNVHPAGHYTIGGDPGGDFFTSIADPYFWVHHGQIDRVWWMWQNQEPESRVYTIAATRTMGNIPPSSPTTLDDILHLGSWMAEDVRIRDVASTLDGPLCYVYE